MDDELAQIAAHLHAATTPEEVFGTLSGTGTEMKKAAKRLYRRLAREVFPDKYRDSADNAVAHVAFKKLHALWEAAEMRIDNGTYGTAIPATQPAEPVIIRSQTQEYVVGALALQDPVFNFYYCRFQDPIGGETSALFKVARSPRDNDLITNEVKALTRLQAVDSSGKNPPYTPTLIESFGYREKGSTVTRQVNILSFVEGYYSLEEVREHYPQGVDPKHMAWMFRRTLAILGTAHQNGVLLGAALPSHIFLVPETHSISVADWSYAVVDPHLGGRITAIEPAYRAWYPEEVLQKEPPSWGVDIYMAAQSMIYVMGGNPVDGTFLNSVPRPIQAFLRGCTLKSPRQRPQDAWALLTEFDELLAELWGKRKFIPFSMPPRQN